MHCLIVVDYQIDKVTGKLRSNEAKEIEWLIISKIRDYIENDGIVYYTLDEHPLDYSKCNESKIIDTPHCIKNTIEVNIYGGVEVYLKEFGTSCPKTSFGSTSLVRKLRGQEKKLIDATRIGITDIEIVGCHLEYDILTTAIMCRAALPEANVRICTELSPYMDQNKAKLALLTMRQLGIQID